MSQTKSSVFSASFLPTEPVGSIPRPSELAGSLPSAELALAEAKAVDATIAEFEATGSPVITDGQQNYSLYPLSNLDGQYLTKGPFRYGRYAVEYLKTALTKTSLAVKQAVISASTLSAIYPPGGIPGYSRDEFLNDLVNEVERDVRQCLEATADSVQMKIAPSLESIDLENRVFERFSFDDRQKIAVHLCSGTDLETFPLADLFRLKAGRFSIHLSTAANRRRVLSAVRAHLQPHQFIFVGVIDPTNPRVESAEEVRDRILEAARFVPIDRLGTTDDCGFAENANAPSITRQTAFAKIKARVAGTALAREALRASGNAPPGLFVPT